MAVAESKPTLMPFSAGDIVERVESENGAEPTRRLVKVVRHNDTHCWTNEDECFLREHGGIAEKLRGFYIAIHSPGYRAMTEPKR